MEAKGEGDVPCYVKKSDGGVYQVRKEAISTGSSSITVGNTLKFTVPTGITIIEIRGVVEGNTQTDHIQYVGVTPGKTYSLLARIKPPDYPPIPPKMSMLVNIDNNTIWAGLVEVAVDSFTLSWSSEINKQTPNVKDY